MATNATANLTETWHPKPPYTSSANSPLLGYSPSPTLRLPSPAGESYKRVDTPRSPDLKSTLLWRPFYLRRTILTLFLLTFISLLIGIEVLLAISNKNNGIASGVPSQHYIWTYGPTAILTLVAVAWNRVSYQSKMIAPWIRLSKQDEAPCSRTLLLDYVSAFDPFVVFKALRNKDFVTSATATIGILIRILIIISTGLITLSLTEVTHGSHPMVVQDRFIDNLNVDASRAGNLPSYLMKGLSGMSFWSYPPFPGRD